MTSYTLSLIERLEAYAMPNSQQKDATIVVPCSLYNEAIAIIRQHQAEQPQPSGYSVSTGLVDALKALKVTIKPTDTDDAMGYAATRNSILNEAIAVARQDRFNPAGALQQREIPLLETLQAIGEALDWPEHEFNYLKVMQARRHLRAAIQMVVAIKPVSVNDGVSGALAAGFLLDCDAEDQSACVKAIFGRAGVKYVD